MCIDPASLSPSAVNFGGAPTSGVTPEGRAWVDNPPIYDLNDPIQAQFRSFGILHKDWRDFGGAFAVPKNLPLTRKVQPDGSFKYVEAASFNPITPNVTPGAGQFVYPNQNGHQVLVNQAKGQTQAQAWEAANPGQGIPSGVSIFW